MKKLIFAIFIVSVFVLKGFSQLAYAVDCSGDIPSEEGPLRDYIAACSDKLKELSGQKKTLADAIAYLNAQIKLTEARVSSTEKELVKLNLEIDDLSGKIKSLDYSLDELTKLFVARVRESYIRKDVMPALSITDSSSGIPSLIRRLEYIKKIRNHDREILVALEKSRLDYNNQKSEKEIKQTAAEKLKKQLASQQASLTSQKASKNKLLADTQNDEKKYQQLLADAQAELVAIQGIVAGLGKEVKVGDVSEGSRVASIIVGASPCSSGTHLHYEVAKNGTRNNPFELLKPISLIWSNEDPEQNGHGSWNWPLDDPIRVTQGYGHTSYSSRYAGDVHTGVDMVSDNRTVKAVKAGELYQGSMRCGRDSRGNPTNLIYVRVKQTDGFDSYYLHVNY